MTPVRWSSEAAADLTQIIQYIHKQNPTAAARITGAVMQRVKSLPDFPGMDRLGRVLGTRELVLSPLPFVVVYRLKDEFVEIVRILHGAQKWP